MYFDTHAHYDAEEFDLDRDQLLSSMPENNVKLIVNPATNLDSVKASIALTEKYDYIYAAVGFHPHDAKLMSDGSIAQLESFTHHPKVVAIGEIGLDYHYDFSPREVQKACLYKQMELARRTKLPVIIHEREACRDCLNIITAFPDVRGVFHCFSGSMEIAEIILKQGWYLSFTGAITFKNARRSLEVIAKMPADRIMVETDSPYLSPVPNRGHRNTSLNLPYIVSTIAGVRNIPVEEAERLTFENGKRFFNI